MINIIYYLIKIYIFCQNSIIIINITYIQKNNLYNFKKFKRKKIFQFFITF